MSHAALVLMFATALSVVLARPVRGQETGRSQTTLHAALLLAGHARSGLPLQLVAELRDDVHPAAEAWTVFGDNGAAASIAVNVHSRVFRCADRPHPSRRCMLKLASIIVHEATHYAGDRSEEAACAHQLAFLHLHEASPALISGVRLSRDFAIRNERNLLAAVRRAQADTLAR